MPRLGGEAVRARLVNHKSEEQRKKEQREKDYRRERRAYRWRVFFVFLPWGALLISTLVTGVLALSAVMNGRLPGKGSTPSPALAPKR